MPPDQRSAPASEWRLHRNTLLASVAGIALSSFLTYSLGVMIGPLEKEFGWTRAQISTGPLILSIAALVFAPIVGVAVDRFGPRRIGITGVLLFCTALALLSTAHADITSWWSLWCLMAVAAVTVSPIVWTAAITHLFVKNRGLALAIALCGTGIASTLVPRLTHELVEAYGWRGAYIGLALIGAVVVLPTVLFLFKGAADKRRAKQAGAPTPVALPGMTARAGLTSPRFLRLAAASTIISFAVCAVIANAVPILVSKGHERGAAASVAGLIGIGAIIGRLCGGYLLDRLNANIVAAVSVLAPVFTGLILLFSPDSVFTASAALLIMGLAVGTELDACAYLASRHFGVRSFGTLFGVLNGLMLFANGVAPLAANYVFDITRSYDAALWMLIPASLVSSALFASLGRYPPLEAGAAAADAAT